MAIVLDIETIGARKPENAEAIDEMAADRDMEAAKFAALCPPLARVVAAGLLHVESGREIAYYDAGAFTSGITKPTSYQSGNDEAGLLALVNTALSKADRIVTFNGRCFDLPVLIHRMVINGVRPSARLLAAAREYRFRPSIHIDVREQFTFFGAASVGTLRAFAIGYGLGDPKADGDGADIARLIEAGDAAGLCDYCLGDVRMTAALLKRWTDLAGVA